MNPRQPIVLVDDNHDDLFILKHLLTRTGLKNAIVTFDHPDEAKRFLEAALRTPETNLIPAMIFSDVIMPAVTGFDLLEWVQARSQLKKVPFVLLSGTPEPEDEARATAAGAVGYFEKFPPLHVLSELLN